MMALPTGQAAQSQMALKYAPRSYGIAMVISFLDEVVDCRT